MSGTPFSLGTRILGAGAALLILVLAVGFALPGTWSAERTVVLDTPRSVLFPLVDAPASWRLWTAWPDSGLVAEGPERGVGSRLRWDDQNLGNGFFEIMEAEADAGVRYRVSVQDGSMLTEGFVVLATGEGGTHVTWRESGDFGWNPLMGYWALLMEGIQGREMEKALARLGELAAARNETPAVP